MREGRRPGQPGLWDVLFAALLTLALAGGGFALAALLTAVAR